MTKEEKEQRKIEKKIQKQKELNKLLNNLSEDNKNTYSFWGQYEEKEEGYEPYQLEEEELEDDDLYEEGED